MSRNQGCLEEGNLELDLFGEIFGEIEESLDEVESAHVGRDLVENRQGGYCLKFDLIGDFHILLLAFQ